MCALFCLFLCHLDFRGDVDHVNDPWCWTSPGHPALEDAAFDLVAPDLLGDLDIVDVSYGATIAQRCTIVVLQLRNFYIS